MRKGVVAGVCVLAAVALSGFLFAKRPRAYLPVAPWDYPDTPNPYKAKHPGSALGSPPNPIVAENNRATLPDGFTIQFVAIGKTNTQNPAHMWAPDGGPVGGEPRSPMNIPDGPKTSYGPERQLLFRTSGGSPDTKLTMYIPASTPSDLEPGERLADGWGATGGNSFEVKADTVEHIFVDDPSASKLEIGAPTGTPATVGSFPNSSSKEVLGSGDWGTARVHRPSSGSGISAKNLAIVEIAVQPPSEPEAQEITLAAFDADGAPVRTNSIGLTTFVSVWDMPKIARFEVRARPYSYIEFRDVHYNPDPPRWRNFAWGGEPKPNRLEIVGASINLTSLQSTKHATGQYGEFYEVNSVFTPDGKSWQDYPANLDARIDPFSAPAGFPGRKMLPAPWVAAMNVAGDAQVRIVAGGSPSSVPGQDFHPEWNPWPACEGKYHDPTNVGSVWVQFSLPPNTSYAQFRVDACSGPWTEAQRVSVSPLPGSGKAEFSVVLGPDIRKSTWGDHSQALAETAGHLDLDRQQVRLTAHFTGQRVEVLKPTSTCQEGRLEQEYDFAPEAKLVDGFPSKLGLKNIAYLEVEERPIHTGYLVQKLPG